MCVPVSCACVQYYLQVDVLDAQYAVLTDAIDRCRDFDAITQAHSQFLTTLLTQVCIVCAVPTISHVANRKRCERKQNGSAPW